MSKRHKKKKLRKVPRNIEVVTIMKRRRAGAFDDKRKSKKSEKRDFDEAMEE